MEIKVYLVRRGTIGITAIRFVFMNEDDLFWLLMLIMVDTLKHTWSEKVLSKIFGVVDSTDGGVIAVDTHSVTIFQMKQ